jgi:hypothetical protein
VIAGRHDSFVQAWYVSRPISASVTGDLKRTVNAADFS